MTPDAPHPGAQLRDDIKAAGHTIQTAAKGMGIARETLNRILIGKTNLTDHVAYYANAFLYPDDASFAYARRMIAAQAAYQWDQDADFRRKVTERAKALLER